LHIGYHVKELLPYPPPGYHFVTKETFEDSAARWFSKSQISLKAMDSLAYATPLILMKSVLDTLLRRPPRDSVLTFAANHVVFREEPWVVEFGRVWDTVSYNLAIFRMCRPILERAFRRPECRKVLCWTEFSKKTAASALDCRDFEDKLDVIPRAVHRKSFVKPTSGGRVRLLFVGSANQAGLFERRGGKEVIESFDILVRRYKELELVIRSEIPQSTRRHYSSQLANPRIRVIDQPLPWKEVEELYLSSDIFYFPCHYESWQIILEAMSYELPVVAIDWEGVPELVEPGRTGFLIKESDRVPQLDGYLPVPPTPAYWKALQETDPRVVSDLVEKVSILIEDERLRRSMGRAGRCEVEQGKFSIEHRNEKLRQVFDEASSNP
jgi:glycosyltransferase involved in cell wall biosynthesis